MLYVGRKADTSGYVRFEARAATSSGAVPPRCDTTAWPSTSMPRLPARPDSCVYSPALNVARAATFPIWRYSMTKVRAGMFMPRAMVSVA